ncbi:hypothetical protein DOTSEDRAFT_32953 [Dothistroma septosporum NZE10]|uniref:Uncharacterized protein n=1 Tax=Dothistroma septosporum (strain NZE10 / CBS 128990) TaxID=675120 RepID=N1PSF7_DOTSN|nr:hypothetical protein DOTSEDRAFT_32953 [Dothistroma septosporum NZE10]
MVSSVVVMRALSLGVRWMLGYVLLAQKCVQSSIPYEITVENWRRVKLAASVELGAGVVCLVHAASFGTDAGRPSLPGRLLVLVGLQQQQQQQQCRCSVFALLCSALLCSAEPQLQSRSLRLHILPFTSSSARATWSERPRRHSMGVSLPLHDAFHLLADTPACAADGPFSAASTLRYCAPQMGLRWFDGDDGLPRLLAGSALIRVGGNNDRRVALGEAQPRKPRNNKHQACTSAIARAPAAGEKALRRRGRAVATQHARVNRCIDQKLHHLPRLVSNATVVVVVVAAAAKSSTGDRADHAALHVRTSRHRFPYRKHPMPVTRRISQTQPGMSVERTLHTHGLHLPHQPRARACVRASSALCNNNGGCSRPCGADSTRLAAACLLTHTPEARPAARDFIERYIRYGANRSSLFLWTSAGAWSIGCPTLAYDLTSNVAVSAVAAATQHHEDATRAASVATTPDCCSFAYECNASDMGPEHFASQEARNICVDGLQLVSQELNAVVPMLAVKALSHESCFVPRVACCAELQGRINLTVETHVAVRVNGLCVATNSGKICANLLWRGFAATSRTTPLEIDMLQVQIAMLVGFRSASARCRRSTLPTRMLSIGSASGRRRCIAVCQWRCAIDECLQQMPGSLKSGRQRQTALGTPAAMGLKQGTSSEVPVATWLAAPPDPGVLRRSTFASGSMKMSS